MGHYQRLCLAGKAVHGIEEEESESFILGSVSSDADPWTVDIGIMDKDVTFKLDSGADDTSVAKTVLNKKKCSPESRETPVWSGTKPSGLGVGIENRFLIRTGSN